MRLKKVDDWLGQELALLDHGQIGKDEHKEGNLFRGDPFNKAQEFLAMAPPDFRIGADLGEPIVPIDVGPFLRAETNQTPI